MLTPPTYASYSPVLDVDGWYITEEAPPGSREKGTLIDPSNGDHYIIKYPKDRREDQLWSELLASYIAGDLLGWEIQRVGLARRMGRLGNLLTYIYRHRSKRFSQELLIEGTNLCSRVDRNFDAKAGNRHTLPLLLRVCDELLVPKYNLVREEFLQFWARALALDTLISNSDRHAGNWAIVIGQDGARMAPLFDHASSLGCEREQVGLEKIFKDNETFGQHLVKFRSEGCHHLRVEFPCKDGSKFEDVCCAFLQIYPRAKQYFESASEINIEKICCLMDSIKVDSGIEEPYVLSCKRIKYIQAILNIGVGRLRSVLQGG